jgi:hypothetical protein
LQIQYIRRQEDIVSAKKELEFIGKELSVLSQKGYPKSKEEVPGEKKDDVKGIEKRRMEFFNYLAHRQ